MRAATSARPDRSAGTSTRSLPISGSRIAAAADSGLFVSSDSGATWNPASGAAATTFNALVEDPTTGWLYAGSLAGVFRSQDGEERGRPTSDGLTNPDVLCLAVLGDGSVLAGTNGGSVFLLERILTAPRGRVARAGEDHSPHVVSPRP